jgi:hypothetical protein
MSLRFALSAPLAPPASVLHWCLPRTCAALSPRERERAAHSSEGRTQRTHGNSADHRQEGRAEKGRRDTLACRLLAVLLPGLLGGLGSALAPLPGPRPEGGAVPRRNARSGAGRLSCALNCDCLFLACCWPAVACWLLLFCAACAGLASWCLRPPARAEGQRALGLAQPHTGRETNEPQTHQPTRTGGRAAGAGAGVGDEVSAGPARMRHDSVCCFSVGFCVCNVGESFRAFKARRLCLRFCQLLLSLRQDQKGRKKSGKQRWPSAAW